MILNIQYLRFFAAFIVILAHSNLLMYGVAPIVTGLGAIGVDIFFVISGFIMPYIIYGGFYCTGSTPKITPPKFFLHRLIRIWPMYFVATMISLIISYLTANGYIKNPTVDLVYVFNEYRYKIDYIIHSLTFTNGPNGPILLVGWTLQFEFIFYTVITLFMTIGARSFRSIFSCILLFIIAMNILNKMFVSDILKQLSRPIMIEFVLGMLVYYLYSSGFRIKKLYSYAILILSPLVIISFQIDIGAHSDMLRVAYWGTISSLMVYSALSLEGATGENKALLFAGNASYSIYLTHGMVSPIMAFIIVRNDLLHRVPLLIYIVLYIITCLFIGCVFHLLLEKTTTRFIKSKFNNLYRSYKSPPISS